MVEQCGHPHPDTPSAEPLHPEMLIFSERHLRQVLAVYAAHYHPGGRIERCSLRPPRPTSPVPEPVHGRIRRRPILGGHNHQYETAS